MKQVDYSQKVLEVKGLKKHFTVGVGKNKLVVPAVDDVTFDVYKREVFGLVGESGSGKTTTGRTIIKLYSPTDGTVDLNKARVSAGYTKNIINIRKIKRNTKIQIIALDENKKKKSDLKYQANKKIVQVRYRISDALDNHKKNLEEIRKPVSEYHKTYYNIKSVYSLDVDAINYKFKLDKENLLESTKNPSLITYRNEIKTEKNKYESKRIGLKESAALEKSIRLARFEELKIEYQEIVEKLEETFKPLIEKDELNKTPKSEVVLKIRELDQIRKEQINKRKEQYLNDLENLIKPDKKAYLLEVKEEKARKNIEVKELKLEIKAIKDALKQDISNIEIKEISNEEKEQIKNKKLELKAIAREKILAEKEIISSIKQSNKSKESLRASRNMQMIFQDPISSLNPRMTVKEIVGEGLTIQGELSKEEIDVKVLEALDLVGLAPEYATRYPHEFSGGQRQRIGIARALIMNPNFIIADEPISSLDVSIRAQVINLLSKLKDDLDLTILFIAHDLSVVRFFCDRIAVMFSGKIVELAPSEELFKNPLHPYTKSLLSAIPQPDPDYEKGRKRTHYNPQMHNYRVDKPQLHEVSPGHFIYANDEELARAKEALSKGGK